MLLETLLVIATVIEKVLELLNLVENMSDIYNLFKRKQNSYENSLNENQKETREVLNSIQKDSGTEWQDKSRKENYSIAL